MLIRKAVSSDIPTLLRLLHQVGDVHHDIRPDIFPVGTLKYDADLLRTLLEERPVFVAEADGKVLGYCFCILSDRPDSRSSVGRRELYIDDLCIDEAARSKGVATALYRHVCCYAREMGCAFITLNVWCGNDAACRFYEKMGLTPRNITMEMPLEDKKC